MPKPFLFTAASLAALAAVVYLRTSNSPQTPLVAPAQSGRAEQNTHGQLPSSPELERWFAHVAEVQAGLRSGNPQFTLALKRAHPYANVCANSSVIGRFRTEAASTNVVGEILAFNLARALGCGDLLQPAVHMRMEGCGLDTLRHLLETSKPPIKREPDRLSALNEIAGDPAVLHGAFKPAPPDGTVKYYALERPELPPNGLLNEDHPLVRFLKHDLPQPSSCDFTLDGGIGLAPENVLARQLSNILLVDALTGQWDRFSGGNIHVNVDHTRARFFAIDNGGSSLGDDQGYLARFEHSVTRFDQPVVARLFALEAFLNHKGDFLGFSDEPQLAKALNISKINDWAFFKARVLRVASHVRGIKGGAYFE